MKTVHTFDISSTQTIEIQVPDLEEKINYFYEPTESLHQFDEITIVYKDKEKEYFLGKDALQYLMNELYVTIKLLLAGKFGIPLCLKGYIGLEWIRHELASRNEATELAEPFIGIEYLLWDNTKDIQTLMYRIGDKYYLEISPNYEWLFGPLVEEDDEDIDEEPEGFYSFEEYEKNYKPLVIAELSKETLLNWKKKCEDIFAQVGITYE